jgi:pyrimidine deaminase RibD-like protein/NTP pyrophosphatase (non-canonical NTP hydrolase)
MDEAERQFVCLAIREARKSVPEDSRVHPKVGVVIVKDGEVLATAFRGENPGSHAEYTAVDSKLRDEALAGATVYTTLEPCTTRRHPKIPCAQRLIDRKVSRVVIGMLDPNRQISGNGQRLLRGANIVTDFFPSDLMAEVEELNREFLRAHSQGAEPRDSDAGFVQLNRGRSLDEWYRVVNTIYWRRNLQGDRMSIFAHLIEIIGGLSLLASQKRKPGVAAETFVSKATAWWMALCGKVGVESVAEMVWAKFPHVCPYCLRCPHEADECTQRKEARTGLEWELLEHASKENALKRPVSLGAWQRMFSRIYPAQHTEEYASIFARCSEELGELAEALRVFPEAPGYFLNEAADLFAWLMHMRNLIDLRKGTPKIEWGAELETEFCKAYPDRCLDCGQASCACPPILDGTIGRIAHELPGGREHFMTPEGARVAFQPRR